jgi:DsrE/DsrF-like family
MKANDTDNYECSRRELADGVLKQAQEDLQRFHSAPRAIGRELHLDGYRWVISDDSTWPLSFLTVCESLNLIPEHVRQDLIDLQSLGTLARWALGCAQGVNTDRHIATGNPYRKLITDLMVRGVQVELCGATAKAHGWGNADLIPGIKITTDAGARTTQLVQKGFVKISES